MQQPCCEYSDTCSALIRQTVDVALPISLVPCAELGSVQILCCGEPRVECCEVGECCGGLTLKITQTITYKIPVEYRVEATSGAVTSDCKRMLPISNCTQGRY